tara:strand:+ start:2787 stop:4052 length:1266 start_codon:yes stop_codon:yes gene_type:complete
VSPIENKAKRLDTDFVRSQFPAFQANKSKDWIFFENAGGAYVPVTVIEKLNRFFVEHKIQPYGASALSRKAGAEMDEAYVAMGDLLNVHPDEITFGPSTTLNFYVLAQSLINQFSIGDEIIVTNQDHEANIGAWRRLTEFGVVIREWQIDKENGELDTKDLERLITPRTKLICCTLCSNLVGTHNDITTISDMAKQVGALIVADGVSYAPHMVPDLQKLGADFYAFSTYKTFGTHQGIMWGSKAALEMTKTQSHYFNDSVPRYRLNPTGPQHAEIAALSGVTEYFDLLYFHHFGRASKCQTLNDRARKVYQLIAKHETVLANKLLSYLSARPNIRLLGQDRAMVGQRASTISFSIPGLASSDIEKSLANKNIAAGSGDFYARRCLEAMGIDPKDGVVRVSMVHYNTEQEVDYLIDMLDGII